MSDNGDALLLAMMDQLIRTGVLDDDDVDAIAGRLDAQGDAMAAHWARTALIEATVGSITSDERADNARSRFRVVSDGGKDDKG